MLTAVTSSQLIKIMCVLRLQLIVELICKHILVFFNALQTERNVNE